MNFSQVCFVFAITHIHAREGYHAHKEIHHRVTEFLYI